MNFNSLHFLVFLPIVLILYWIVPHKFRWALLLVASYYFYMSWEPWLVFLILSTTLVSYFAGFAIEKSQKKSVKRLWMILTLVICIGMLIFFKYFNFLIQSAIDVLNLFSMNLNSVSFDIILPIGISFYTFQTLSYVIDVYKGTYKAERHIGYYALFVCFFPQLVAGPIERPKDLIPQLKAKHKLNLADVSCGIRILAVGFFYKCVVADVLAIYVDHVFSNAGEANALSVLLAGFLFTTQMYCDFAGYSEIASGSARLMGIKLTTNFNRPFMSVGYSDFFRRWHITLTRWFTDYVYIPLGGNRKGKARRIFNTFVVFLLCGLWHGANTTYIVWGLYAAFFLSIETLLRKPAGALRERMGIPQDSRILYALKIIGTYLLLIPAGIIFRAESMTQAGQLLSNFFVGWGFGAEYFAEAMSNLGLSAQAIIQITLCCVCEVMLWRFSQIGRDQPIPALADGRKESARAARYTVITVYTVLAVILCWIALLSSGGSGAFQYFQF